MATTNTKLMTAEELLLLREDRQRYELVRGVLRTRPLIGHLDSYYALNVGSELFMHVEANRLGRAYSSNTGFLLERDPDYVLAPDASFVRQERVETATEERGYFPGAPDFVAEVISPSDRYADADDKVKEWLNAGALMVVVVNPRDRTVRVHTPDSVMTLTASDTLDGGDVVPGWRLSVAEIFA